ncbi:MAG: hypothetical protein AABW79_02350 [Nanoarchaeota archaeon]
MLRLKMFILLFLLVIQFTQAFEVGIEYNPGRAECTPSDNQCSPDLNSVAICENGKFNITDCQYGCNNRAVIPQCNTSSQEDKTGIVLVLLAIIVFILGYLSLRKKHTK